MTIKKESRIKELHYKIYLSSNFCYGDNEDFIGNLVILENPGPHEWLQEGGRNDV